MFFDNKKPNPSQTRDTSAPGFSSAPTQTLDDNANPQTLSDDTPTVPMTDTKTQYIEEIEKLAQKVDSSPLPHDLALKAKLSIERLRRIAKLGGYSQEFEIVEKFIYWITSIPWRKTTQDTLDIPNAKVIMNKTHYGMETVKELILDYLAVMKTKTSSNERNEPVYGVSNPSNGTQNTNPQTGDGQMAILRSSSANAPVMLFVGLQGVGKTSIAKSIAQAMGRKFIRVSLGAIGDVDVLRGQSKSIPGAEPGQIIKALVRTQSMNPIILLDEVEKASGNKALLSDIMAALLEILDPEQNSAFVDRYIDYPVDLSRVFFICTANNLGTLSTALLDRMEIIRFSSYTDEEKESIAKNYSMPKVLENTGLGAENIVIDEKVWPLLIRPVGFDAGLRQLERNLATLVRRVARRILEGAQPPITITPENLREFVLPDQGPLS